MSIIIGYAGVFIFVVILTYFYQMLTTNSLTTAELTEARAWLLDCWSFDILDIKHFVSLTDDPWLDQEVLESWTLGCLSKDLSEIQEFLNNCSDQHIEKAISEYYQGGLRAFRRSL